MFQPATPLEAAIHAGRLEAVLEGLRPLSPAQRAEQRSALLRVDQIMDAARWPKTPAARAAWGMEPTREQSRALGAALFICGTVADAARLFLDDELFVALGREFQPRALQGLADAMLGHSPQRIRLVQALVAAGLASRPTSEAYVLGLMSIPYVVRDAARLQAMLAADPGLAPQLLRVFEIEGTAEHSLASSDKYNHVPGLAWGEILLGLVAAGVTTRAGLLDKTLGALENDWPAYRSGWFSRFHGELAPDAAAMQPHQGRYLALCHSRIAPTVGLALDALAVLDAAAPLEPMALLDALRPALAGAVKTQIEAALKLADRVVQRAPALAPAAAAVALLGLVHESAALQKAVLRRLAAWGLDDAALEQLQGLAAGVAAVNQPALQALMAGSRAAAAARPAEPAPVPAPGPAAPRAGPLDAGRRLAPVANVDALVELVAHVFENDTDIDAFERALAALVRLAPQAAAGRSAWSPVLRRAAKLRQPLALELARLLRFVVLGERTQGQAGIDHGGNPSPVQALLIERIDGLMSVARLGLGLEPLSAPTHRGGFIDPAVFVARVAAHQAGGLRSPPGEQVLGLLRLAPGAPAALRRQAAQLADEPLVRALRYALGDDVAPGPQAALFAAAARIRHPGADDAALERVQGDLGPDAARAARYAWRVESRSHSVDGTTYHHHELFVDTAAVPAGLPGELMAVRRHPPGGAAREHYRWWSFGGIDEASIGYAATLLPSGPEAFHAEGARALGNNLDWGEAQWQNAAYLRPLLDPLCAMTPMATLLLALGLAGKEPGQTAIAVDALAQAQAEGRLDAARLGDTLRALLATPLLKPARLRQSLQAALRAEPGLARPLFGVLATAVTAQPAPRELAGLLELLLELKLGQGLVLAPAQRAALAGLQPGGRGKALLRELLA